MSSILFALSGLAHAFAPIDGQGIEPQRTWWRHVDEQARLTRSSDGFRTWQHALGGTWNIRWDEASRSPRYLWGSGFAVPTGSRDALVASLSDLVADHEALLGLENGGYALRSARYHEPSDTWYVDFDTLREPGTPTYRGGISMRVKAGRLVLVSIRTSPGAPVTGGWTLDRRSAERRAILDGPARTALHEDRHVQPMLLELLGDDGLELRRVWQVTTRTTSPPGRWVAFVDAADGQLLSVHNEVRFLTGDAGGLHHERLLDGSPLVTTAFPYLPVTGADGVTTWTDQDGHYEAGPGPVSSTLDGQWVRVENQEGTNGELTSESGDFRWELGDATQAEIDTYAFLHDVRDWGLSVDPTVGMMNRTLVSNVNLPSVCNAYFDGAVNFFSDGQGCANTGQIADVAYHEWGHGFHYYSIQSGFFDGSLSEGAADTVSVFMTGDPYIAPTFFVSGEAIRYLDPDRVYPDDFRSDSRWVHENGLIFGGAMWDLLNLLRDEHGDEEGQDITEQIFAGLLRGGTDIPGTYYEAMVADDDDGDLGNGTPHGCAITEAFRRHGIGSYTAGVAFVPTHDPLVATPPDAPTPLAFQVVGESTCGTDVPEEATLFYRTRPNGDWKSSPAVVRGDEIDADLPALPAGTFVEYFLDGETSEGSLFRSPAPGEYAPYTTYVGDTLEVHCDTFDEDNGGYGGKAVGDDGDDDWGWATPKGMGGDPAAAYTGRKVWGNDLGGDTSDGKYEDGESSRLRSSKLDTYHYTDVFLQYRRWLQVEDGEFDQAWIEANGKQVWANADSESGIGHHLDQQWMSHTVDLKNQGDQGELQLMWFLSSDGAAEYGGWNIDDVCLRAPDTLENRLGVSHLEAFDAGGPVGLSWTNPRHAPANRVVVLRRSDRFPEGPEDGVVVADLTDLVLGETVRTIDPSGGGEAYYAAFATDGSQWTALVTEGVNAARVESRGFPAGELLPAADGSTEPTAACGCASNTSGGWLAVAPLPLLLLRRQRRR